MLDICRESRAALSPTCCELCSNYPPFYKVYGLVFCWFSHLCRLKAGGGWSWTVWGVPGRRFAAQPRGESQPTQLSHVLKLCSCRRENLACFWYSWERCGETKPGYQMVILPGIFSPEFCYRPSPHHSLLKHMKASISFWTILFNGLTQVCSPAAKHKWINPAAEQLGLGQVTQVCVPLSKIKFCVPVLWGGRAGWQWKGNSSFFLS